jgi:hypothetical protein
VLWIRIRKDPHCFLSAGSGFGSRRAKATHNTSKNKNFFSDPCPKAYLQKSTIQAYFIISWSKKTTYGTGSEMKAVERGGGAKKEDSKEAWGFEFFVLTNSIHICLAPQGQQGILVKNENFDECIASR